MGLIFVVFSLFLKRKSQSSSTEWAVLYVPTVFIDKNVKHHIKARSIHRTAENQCKYIQMSCTVQSYMLQEK